MSMSFRLRILGLTLGGALVVGAASLVTAELQLRRQVDESQTTIYTERLDSLAGQVEAMQERLDKTGMADAYRSEFQRLFIARQRSTQERLALTPAKTPVIVDASGAVLLGADRPHAAELARILDQVHGQEEGIRFVWVDLSDEPHWIGSLHTAAWDWHLCFVVPHSIRYQEVYRFRAAFTGLLIGILVPLAALMLWLTGRNLRPISQLTAAAAALASGQRDTPLPVMRDDELGLLTRSFTEMRDAIRQQLEALQISEGNLATTLASISEGIIATDRSGHISQMNPAACDILGIEVSAALGQHLDTCFPLTFDDADRPAIDWFEAVLEAGRDFVLPTSGELALANGRRIPVVQSVAPIRNDQGDITGCVLVFRDISEQLALEAQLRQSQKMDAIGQLAGGVAHDFNNMLGAIQGAGQLLARKSSDPGHIKLTDMISTACERAADLTSKLLAFSRKGKIESTPVDMHQLINQTCAMLERTIDRRIVISQELNAETATVTGDPSQLQNALLNLGINARDAMPDGGRLTYRTQQLQLAADDHHRLPAGIYLSISVSDTGCGIPEAVQRHIFEPFFTTKEAGKGTGLGLAAVYGTVQEHEGDVSLSSVPGSGTTFTIVIPSSDQRLPNEPSTQVNTIDLHGRVLLVDDEELFRSVTRHLLEDAGLEVIEAQDGEAGLAAWHDQRDSIDLVIADMVMPRLDGAGLFRRLRSIDPEAKVVIMSGFLGDNRVDQLREQGLFGFLPKPACRQDLARILGRALKSPGDHSRS